jgi:malate synthase
MQPVQQSPLPTGLTLHTPWRPEYADVLTPSALIFLEQLHEKFNASRLALLEQRAQRQQLLNAGAFLDFLPETADIRAAHWRVDQAPHDLTDRRVEITGPVDRKMVINALNSGASCFMADFEDATAPTFANLIQGQAALMQAVTRHIDFTDPHSGKKYTLSPTPATLLARPRGLHLDEAHVAVHGQPLAGSLFDFALYCHHNAATLLARGSGPYFYLPKLEHHQEARWWADVFKFTEMALNLPKGCIKATVLIETLPAAFQMDEILYELRHNIVALNCGRWDYLFSYIKTLQAHPAYILPDRAAVTMAAPFMNAYCRLLVQTCHKRGAHAMGGMAAQIPIKDNPEANEKAMAKVRADKEREATMGFDGTWVAHPALVPIAKAVFDTHMPAPNQVEKVLPAPTIIASDLLLPIEGPKSQAGLYTNVEVGCAYVRSWLAGQGCVPLHNLMEDAATAEICRAQLWQWRTHHVTLDSGQEVTAALLEESLAKQPQDAATALFRHMVLAHHLDTFLTLPAYTQLLSAEA